MTEITFQARGRGEFPLDMLRHDKCWPVSAKDAEELGYRYGPNDNKLRGIFRMVTLRCDRNNLTPLRWHSFNWVVEVIG